MRIGLYLQAAVAAAIAFAPASAEAAPSCTLSVSPTAVTPGRTATLRWSAEGAATIRLAAGDARPAPRTGTQTVTPAATTTYVAEVVDRNGAKAECHASVAVVPEATSFAAWPPDHMRSLPTEYLERARASIADGLGRARLDRDIGWVLYAVQALAVDHDREEVGRHFATRFRLPDHRRIGFGLHAVDTLRLYGLYHDGSRQMPGRLAAPAQRHLRDEMWRVASGSCRQSVARARETWTLTSSENHDLASKSGCLLATQWLARSPEHAERRFEDGTSAREQYPAWRDFLSTYLDERARRGLFAEIASPTYEDELIQALLNIHDFSDDAVLRTKAEMVLDLMHAVMAEDSLRGVRGGGKSRVYTFRPSFWGVRDRGFDLLFGTPPELRFVGRQYPALATSSYYPPAVVAELARDDRGRGRYASVARRPGVLAAPEGRSGPINPERSVLRYSWATPAYIIGTTMLDPALAYAPVSSQNRWQGIIFRGDAEDRIATQLTRLTRRGTVDEEQRTHNAFFSLQHRNVLLTRKLGNPGTRTQVYLSETLDEVEEESGWIFIREGEAFAAVRVVEGGYRWLDPTRRHRAPSREERFITLGQEDAPIILLAEEAAEHAGDFARFKASVMVRPVVYRDGVLQFSGLTFYPPPRLGLVGNATIELEPRRVFDSPHIRSDFGSGYVEIRKGAQRLVLDFRDPDHPRKSTHGN
jgi:hypothetical protein